MEVFLLLRIYRIRNTKNVTDHRCRKFLTRRVIRKLRANLLYSLSIFKRLFFYAIGFNHLVWIESNKNHGLFGQFPRYLPFETCNFILKPTFVWGHVLPRHVLWSLSLLTPTMPNNVPHKNPESEIKSPSTIKTISRCNGCISCDVGRHKRTYISDWQHCLSFRAWGFFQKWDPCFYGIWLTVSLWFHGDLRRRGVPGIRDVLMSSHLVFMAATDPNYL